MSGKRALVSMEKVNTVYDNLATATKDAELCSSLLVEVQGMVDHLVGEAILDGRIDGKNDTVREAKARELFAGQFNELNNLKMRAREANTALLLAKIEQSRIRDLIRVKELTGKPRLDIALL